MSAELLLSRLKKARKTGPENWVACCPAHEDKNPSMTIRETGDGRVLLHCFAGCEVEQILGAVGLTFDALFPEKPIERGQPLRRPYPAADVLEVLARESLIVSIAAADMEKGKPVDAGRMIEAHERIEKGRSLANG